MDIRVWARHLPIIVAASLVSSSVAYWIVARAGRAVATPSGAPGQVTVVDDLDQEYLQASDDPGQARGAGHLTFGLAPGERLIGIGVATVFPESDRHQRPSLGHWLDVTGVQEPSGIDLRTWIKDRSPTGTHYLIFGLWVDCAGAMEMRTGWARFDPTRLVAGSLTIDCPKRETVRFEVQTALGHPVPGALLSVDRGMSLEPGLISYLGITGADGAFTVSGLEADRDWYVRLPDGVGPFRNPIMATFDTPSERPVVIRVEGMTGEWSFVRHHLRFVMPGGSARILSAECPCNEMPDAWPVNSWIGPGRGPWTPFYVTLRQSRMTETRPLPLLVRFHEGEPVKLEDAKVSSKITKIQAKGPSTPTPPR